MPKIKDANETIKNEECISSLYKLQYMESTIFYSYT